MLFLAGSIIKFRPELACPLSNSNSLQGKLGHVYKQMLHTIMFVINVFNLALAETRALYGGHDRRFKVSSKQHLVDLVEFVQILHYTSQEWNCNVSELYCGVCIALSRL